MTVTYEYIANGELDTSGGIVGKSFFPARIITLPAPFGFSPEVFSPNVHFFSGSTPGISPVEDTDFTETEAPTGLSAYAIANSQDFFLTPKPQYVISLFLNLPSTFFSEFDIYHQVTASDATRLDLISYKYYLNVEYVWVILLANNILDPFNIPIGTILRIPSETIVINEWIVNQVKKLREPATFFFGTT